MKTLREQVSKATINDVASRAGVSKATVSRYINGRYEMMSKEVALRIQSVIEELGYRPSRIAQNLKLKKTGIIGCVVADITSDFSAYLVEGISEVFLENNYQVLLVNTNNDPVKEVEGIQSLLDSKVDGLIVNTTGGNEDFLIDVRRSGVPIVIADRYLENMDIIDTITSTNYVSTVEGIRFLHDQGYDHVYFFGQSLGNNKIRVTRHLAFLEAKSQFYNRDGSSNTYFITNERKEMEIKKALNEIKMNHKNENVALFAVNGMMLLDLVVALKESNLKIGEDFGLCGFDDWKWASLIEPGITTIRQDTLKVGSRSASRLIELIQSDHVLKPKLVELPTKLIVRGSTTIKSKK